MVDFSIGVEIFTSFLAHFFVHEVCYPPYGCFSSKPPFDNSLYPLPRAPKDINTTFWLYTKEISQAHLDPAKRNFEQLNTKNIVVIGHGFLEDITAWWTPELIKNLLSLNDVSVIVVNWREGARLNYNQAVGNSRLVGRQVGFLLENIFNNTDVKPENTHLIGFSLGAHMMGYAGDWLKEKGVQVARITGLDPAGVYFEGTPEKVRLDPGDANFVDVIHSDSRTIYIKGLGASQSLGHADFYPNGGYHQPGCMKVTFDILSKENMYKYIACGHYRAVSYFIESIQNPNAFMSYKCNSYDSFQKGSCKTCTSGRCSNMGYHVGRKKRGNFYLLTNDRKPFSGFHYVITVVTGKNDFAGLELQIIGQNGKSEIYKKESSFLSLEKSNTIVVLSKTKLGPVKKIKITRNAAWFNGAWYLKKVIVYSAWNFKRAWFFWTKKYSTNFLSWPIGSYLQRFEVQIYNVDKYMGCVDLRLESETKVIELKEVQEDLLKCS